MRPWLTSHRVLPDEATIRQPDCVFQSKSCFTADLLKEVQSVSAMDPNSITKKGNMDTQRNPNEPGKPGAPGQQGGQQQDRERQERERREREKQGGGGQHGGGQQGGR